jgi:hypothetical protein
MVRALGRSAAHERKLAARGRNTVKPTKTGSPCQPLPELARLQPEDMWYLVEPEDESWTLVRSEDAQGGSESTSFEDSDTVGVVEFDGQVRQYPMLLPP